MSHTLNFPELSLIVLIGVSGSGKSSFAHKFFKPTEIISSDTCRALVSDDENNQQATDDAFDVLHYLVAKRLKRGLLTVVDATNVQRTARVSLIELAKQYHCLPIALILETPEEVCQARNAVRPNRNFGPHVVRHQYRDLKRSFRYLKEEGFNQIIRLRSVEEINAVTQIQRHKMYNNKQDESGPLDIIGDVHGCFSELSLLLAQLGYQIRPTINTNQEPDFEVFHPEKRKAVFVGDLVDRGPDTPNVLRLVMRMVEDGSAYCVMGNHDKKLHKYLKGNKVIIKNGLEQSVEQFANVSEVFKQKVIRFIDELLSHYVFDKGKLVVAHAGILEEMQGRGSAAVRSFCLYGESTGEIDEFGLPVRYPWAKDYKGKAKVVYGHTPVPEAEWLNYTLDIDTGCVFGGKLTALRYPEETLVSVPAQAVYYAPSRPLVVENTQPTLTEQYSEDTILDIESVSGKKILQTRLRANIIIREENAIAALESMSRFAINPKWLIYLPPTMSPCETEANSDYLEHPTQVLSYFQKKGISHVVAEEKHMGSRAIIVICKDEGAAFNRFKVKDEGIGVCYTRTGRSFFTDKNTETEFLARMQTALTNANFWEKLQTDWVILDTELMPWSAKAQALLKSQYASVGSAGTGALTEVIKSLVQLQSRGLNEGQALLTLYQQKTEALAKYIIAYQQYCWPVHSLSDYRIAPFHILATEGQVHTDKTHVWHLQHIAEIAQTDPSWIIQTQHQIIDLQEETSKQAAIDVWLSLIEKGGEGMVFKPMDYISYSTDGLVQPAIKCRGKEYLRIIYGPEYHQSYNLNRLKHRGIFKKQALALREFALGIEALERFVKKAPLRTVHEMVFGILALESESIDPRL